MDTSASDRSSRIVLLALASVLLLAALALIWAGAVLEPSDREAMEGGQLLLFSLVPIRPFAWVMAAVFALLSVALGVRASRQ